MATCGYYHQLVDKNMLNNKCACIGCLGTNCSNCLERWDSAFTLRFLIQEHRCKRCLQQAATQRVK
ncbi:MAG: hypothetical protein MJ158_03080 [Alphaproteobacteria bacterium]|nr:hypothetical protein [Alphaproteobacteria bacterium]